MSKEANVILSMDVVEIMKSIREAGRIFIVHHDDNDGLVGAKYLYDFCIDNSKGEVITLMWNYKNAIADYNGIAPDEMENCKTVYIITDYFISNDDLKMLSDNKSTSAIIWLDHHNSSVKSLKSLCPDNVYTFIDEKECGTTLCWSLIDRIRSNINKVVVRDYFNSVDLLNDLVWCYDIKRDFFPKPYHTSLYKEMIITDKAPYYLNAFTFKGELSTLNSEVLNRLINEDGYLLKAIELGKEFYELNLKVNELIFRSFARKGVLKFKNKEYNVYVRNGHGSGYGFNDHINEVDAVILFNRLDDGSWTYSMFSSKDGFNGEPIAASYGGGGHPHACGWKCKENLFPVEETEPVE